MINDREIAQMLAEIFPPKPEPVASQLPAELEAVLGAAKELGLTWIPVIIIETEPGHNFGMVDFNTYSEVTVRVWSTWNGLFGDEKPRTRTNQQMARTFAHELGHCFHIQDGVLPLDVNFGYCENFADEYTNKLLGMVGIDRVTG